MKKYSDITYKYLKTQKKKSILTIIGIILSVALISSIGTMFFSLRQSEIDKVKRDKGTWHFGYSNASKELCNKLKKNVLVDKIAIYSTGEKIEFKKNNYINIKTLNKKGFDILPFKIEKGKKPKTEKEIAIEKWALEIMKDKPKINDKVKFVVNGKEKEFILTGILENDIASQYNQKASAITASSEEVTDENNNTIFVKLKNGVSIKNHLNEFKNKGKYKEFATNSQLLTLLGQGEDHGMERSIFVMEAILVSLVVISTVIVIYNAFHISVLERIKQFGILRSIGASPKQIRTIVLKEATILSIVGIPIGLISGLFGLKFVLSLIGSERLISANQIVISKYILIISSIIGLVSVYLSAILPACKASKVSPLDAIYNRGSIKKEKIKRIKNPILKLLKIESVMSYKNMKRSKKKFRITKISIGISVILFVVISDFLGMAVHFEKSENEDMKISYEIQAMESKDNKKKFTDEYLEKINNIKGVDKVYTNYNLMNTQSIIPMDRINKRYLELLKNGHEKIDSIKDTEGKEYALKYAPIEVYESQKINNVKKYLKSGDISVENIDEENGVIVGGKVSLRDEKNNKVVITDVTNFKIGDEIELDVNENAHDLKGKPKKIVKVKVMGILKEEPFGNPSQGFHMITTKKVLKNIQNNIEKNLFRKYAKRDDAGNNLSEEERSNQYNDAKDLYIHGFYVITKNDADKEKIATTLRKLTEKDSFVNFIDKEKSRKEGKQDILQFKIFVYGFIVVISLIGSLNIINTVSTNLILRKREFATLKSIGMSMKQINKMVIEEGILYGITGAVYGLIISVPLSYLLNRQVGSIRDYGWQIPWNYMGIALAASIVIVLISIVFPLRRIKKGNVIEDIRIED